MDRRQDLQNLLMSILGSNNVYFQPPETVKLNYPCIIYNRSRGDTRFADNNPYSFVFRYDVTVVSRDPEEDTIMKLAALPMCTHERFYTADGLNHDVFNLYY